MGGRSSCDEGQMQVASEGSYLEPSRCWGKIPQSMHGAGFLVFEDHRAAFLMSMHQKVNEISIG